jgi:dolichyl-phosphate-mannose--protein O-mannosyl transferase
MSSDHGLGEVGTRPTARYSWTPTLLTAVRTDPTRRRALLAIGLVLGLALGWVHWLGLVVGGVLVGLVSATLWRALAAGLALGVVVLLLHVVASPTMGVLAFLTLTPLSMVSVATALVAPVWGSLARAVV